MEKAKNPYDADEWETMLRYRASLGDDFKIKSNRWSIAMNKKLNEAIENVAEVNNIKDQS